MKQVILVRQDLKLPKGKLAVQVAHASVEALDRAQREDIERWRSSGAKKVALKVADEKTLLMFYQKAKSAKLPTVLIHDAGKTVLEPGTLTCAGIGPADEARIDAVTGSLKCL